MQDLPGTPLHQLDAAALEPDTGGNTDQTEVAPTLPPEAAGERYCESREEAARSIEEVREAEYAREHRGGWSRPPGVLDWLHDHQEGGGQWNARKFREATSRLAPATGNCRDVEFWKQSDDVGSEDNELEVTALSLLAYLEAGYDHKEGEWRSTCRRALMWLRDSMGHDGVFLNARNRREQALATAAFAGTYGLSGDNKIKEMAELALAALLAQRTPGSGWASTEFDEPDILTTFHAVYALVMAKLSGMEIETAQVYADVESLLTQLVTTVSADTRYAADVAVGPDATREGDRRRPIEAAAWVVMMLWTGKADLNDSRIESRAALLAKPDNLPVWKAGRVDYLYWWVGSLALYQVGGKHWKSWEKAQSETLLEHQRGWHEADVAHGCTTPDEIDEHGSWDAVDPWNADGGRVRAAALAALTQETWQRYQRLQDSD